MEYLVEMHGITKQFPGVTANYRVDFKARRGEIHALLGENGAGKTTLMNILFGLYKPDEGVMYVEGEPYKPRSPREAIERGIFMVHQHFKLIPSMTVLENLTLGLKGLSLLLDYDGLKSSFSKLVEAYGLDINLEAPVWQLSMGERQKVEILKALARDAHILILDEPTGMLTLQEVEPLIEALEAMRGKGLTIVFITHKLREALEAADRVTVLRKGRLVASDLPASEVDEEALATLMIGRSLSLEPEPEKTSKLTEPLLEVEGLEVLGDNGLPAVKNVSFKVMREEILGVAGVAGSGQRELAEAIAGLRTPSRGVILFEGKRISGLNSRETQERGVSLIPEDRVNVGIARSLTVAENAVLGAHRRFSKRAILDLKAVRSYADSVVRRFEVATPSLDAPVITLSGGNLQRLIVGRELSKRPRLLVACYPTRGLDVAATNYVTRELMREEKQGGCGVILISEDLEELRLLSDRILVLCGGEATGIVDPRATFIEEISLLMTGTKRVEAWSGRA